MCQYLYYIRKQKHQGATGQEHWKLQSLGVKFMLKPFLGLPLDFEKFLPVYIFKSNFSLKFKTVLSSIMTLKRYFKATLNVFFNKINFE